MKTGSKEHITATKVMIDSLLQEFRKMAESKDLDRDAYEEALKELTDSFSTTRKSYMLAGYPSSLAEADPDHDPYMPDGRRKKVLCVELKKIYDSAAEAHRDTGVNSANLHQALQGNLRTAGGYHWIYIDPDLAKKAKTRRKR